MGVPREEVCCHIQPMKRLCLLTVVQIRSHTKGNGMKSVTTHVLRTERGVVCSEVCLGVLVPYCSSDLHFVSLHGSLEKSGDELA